MQCPQPEEPEGDQGQANGDEHPFPPSPGGEYRSGAEHQHNGGLDGDASVGRRKYEVDHSGIGSVDTRLSPTRSRLIVSSMGLTPRIEPSGTSRHSSLLSGSEAMTTAL